jgi:hypothetical protein
MTVTVLSEMRLRRLDVEIRPVAQRGAVAHLLGDLRRNETENQAGSTR